MGGGNYSYTRATANAACNSTRSREEIFSHSLDDELKIKNKIRESRDSEEHKNSQPVIVALDVTGSMGQIPEDLVKNTLPKLMGYLHEILSVNDAQISFMGIGDEYSDTSPIQMTQFETSDELVNKWLTKLFIENGGGGNDGESYALAWYAAAFHTKTDCYDKRGEKGLLVTIGDEKYHETVSKQAIKSHFGCAENDMPSSEAYNEACKKWDVWHIVINNWTCRLQQSKAQWRKLLGEKMVEIESTSSKEILEALCHIFNTHFGVSVQVSKSKGNQTSEVQQESHML